MMDVSIPAPASPGDVQGDSLLKQCRVNLQEIAKAVEKYRRDHANVYPAKLVDLTPKYLDEVPTCAAAENRDTYSPSYRASANSYRLCCSGHNHKELRYNQPYVVNSSGVPQVLPNASSGSGANVSPISQLNQGILEGDLEKAIEILTSRPELRQQTYQGVPALTQALGNAIGAFTKKQGNIDIVNALLQAGANVNGKMPDGKSAFYHALATTDEALILHLLEQKANPNLPDRLGNSALGNLFKLYATYDSESMLRVTRLLLDHGADLNSRQGFGTTAVGIAANYKLTEVVKLLRERGAR